MNEALKAKLISKLKSTFCVYCASVLLSFPIAVTLIALITPALVPLQAETAAYGVKNFISRQGSHDLNSLEITRLLERYNLSWLYITDGSSKPSAETSRFAPNMVDYPMRSGTINLRGTEYYEAVLALPTGFMIHVGMDYTFPGLPLSALEDLLFFWNMPFRGGTVIAIFILAGAINFIVLSRIFLTPLSKFRQDIDNLAATAAPSLVAFDKITLSPLASSELWNLKKSVHSLFESLGQHERGKERANAAAAPAKEGPWQNPSETELQAVSDGRLPGVGDRKARNTVHALKALKQSEETFGENITEGVLERFPGIVSGVVFMKGDVLDGKSTSDSIVKSAGLNTGQLVELQNLNLLPIFEQARTSGKAINLGPMSLKRTGLDAIMHKLNAQHIVLAPIRHRRRYLGFMLVLTTVALGPDQIRALERLLDQTASVYNSLLLREAKEEKIWTDPLTKLRNRSYLQEVVTDLTTTINVTSGQTYAIAYFSVNSETGSTDDNLDNYALCVAKALSHLKETQHLSKLGDLSKLEFIRAQPLEFALIIRGENETFYEECCLELTRLVETSLRAERTTGHHLVIGLGLALFPFDALKGEDVLARAQLAMVLAEQLAKPEQNRSVPGGYRVTTSLAKAKHIPANFKPLRKFSAVKGDLGVLDAAEVIQSMASGGRTGILSVEDPVLKRTFTLLIQDGKPIGASLDGLLGMDALVEFVSTFETGSFIFSEKDSLENEAPSVRRQAMPSLVNGLMDAALAADNLAAARQIIRDLKTPIMAQYSDAAWRELFRQEEPGEREQHLLKEVMRMANGRHNLEAIFAQLKYAPTAMVWHATARLASHGLINYAR